MSLRLLCQPSLQMFIIVMIQSAHLYMSFLVGFVSLTSANDNKIMLFHLEDW